MNPFGDKFDGRGNRLTAKQRRLAARVGTLDRSSQRDTDPMYAQLMATLRNMFGADMAKAVEPLARAAARKLTRSQEATRKTLSPGERRRLKCPKTAICRAGGKEHPELRGKTDKDKLQIMALAECLELIERASTARPLQKCLTEIAALSELKHRIARGLCRRGILREDEGKVLLFFTRRIYPEVDPGPEDALVAELTEAIFTDTDEVSPHVAALIALGNGVGLLNGTFPRKDLRQRRERLEAIARGDVGTVSQAAAAAREAIEAAMLVCVIVPAIIT